MPVYVMAKKFAQQLQYEQVYGARFKWILIFTHLTDAAS